jgi:chlorophyll synthase
MGVRSLPVLLGPQGAARVASAVMLAAQLVVVALLASWQRPWHAAAIGALVLVQALMMWRFLGAPRERALWLSALGVPFYVSGMMIAAFAVRTTPVIEAFR